MVKAILLPTKPKFPARVLFLFARKTAVIALTEKPMPYRS